MDQPAPDTKDWTWTLERPCPECGYDASKVDPSDVAAAMRANAAGFRSALKGGDIVSERPPVAPGAGPKWSALEYGAHVRDVYKLAAERITKMIKKTAPTFKDWDQDKAAIDGKYASADPDKVSYDLAVNVGKVADLLDKVRGTDWERTGMRSDGAGFTIGRFAVYMLHDVRHHLWDVEQGYEAIREARKAAK
ncbi:MAG: DinB family protein [Acidimicrobiales bacterium]